MDVPHTVRVGPTGPEALALHSNSLAIEGQCILVTQAGVATAAAITFLTAFAADRKIGEQSSLPPMRVRSSAALSGPAAFA
jgi:hypothetical protein